MLYAPNRTFNGTIDGDVFIHGKCDKPTASLQNWYVKKGFRFEPGLEGKLDHSKVWADTSNPVIVPKCPGDSPLVDPPTAGDINEGTTVAES